MDSFLRTLAIYAFLLLVFRISGKRSLGQITTFDFVLLLVIGEATQQAMIGKDFSVTTAWVVIATLIGADIGISLLKRQSTTLERWLEGTPLIIVEDGKPLAERMRKCRVDEADVMSAARRLQGLERMEQIKYAVLERNGEIAIIPK